MLWLTKIFNANYIELKKFLNLLSAEEAYYCTCNDLKSLNIPAGLTEKLSSAEIKDSAKYDFEFCQKENIKLIDFTSKEYPYNLSNISSPPILLYYKGNIFPKDEVSVSIIGSRKYSEYGKACTKKFAYELACSGITIISGMAYGIDSFSHSYALSANGRTIAVLGSGIDIIYPKSNEKLYSEIIESGAVISEFPLHTAPIAKNFPIRNRIVAGLSLGTLVIEASKKSGTMITARFAAENGRNVYSVPGQLFNISSEGTNLLIKDGAKIVTSPRDIIEDIYSEISQTIPRNGQLSLFTEPQLNNEEYAVYRNLSLDPMSIDKLYENLNIPFNTLLATLSMLELNGYIKSLPGKQYVLNVD